MSGWTGTLIFSLLIFGTVFVAMIGSWTPFYTWFVREEVFFTRSFHKLYKPNWSPRSAALFSVFLVPILGIGSYSVIGHWLAAVIMGFFAFLAPRWVVRLMLRKRLKKLEDQIVSGIQTLASGVRAGLNLVQSFELLARNGPAPLNQEIRQMLREYEYGLTLEQAMINAGIRIGSPTYRLLFSALETHRRRGGNLGETLDRIADAIREIHRLEKQVDTLTAQGRAAARMMAIMPMFIILILWMIDPRGVGMLFTDPVGKTILLIVVVLIFLGFLWIRRIIDIDI
ncbi:MAG: hypothetical protein BIFFINMI_02448 [Phycisphaerae bacterium]|nr:hypothetical protein [Phycisphaerae bacterium]